MIQIINKEDCTGCSACYNVCPKNCIKMEADDEGFIYPIVNIENCINCNKCNKVCPIINPYEKRDKHQHAFAAINFNNKIRLKSSSGGIFYAISDFILQQNGIIYGAAFDKKWNVFHTHAQNKEQLLKLMGSKYIQSNINTTYDEIKRELKSGRKVLFCGTSCQVSGLNHFLAKEYENLLTLELLCHGVSSYKIWNNFLRDFLKKIHLNITDVTEISFRNKSPNTIDYQFSIKDNHGNVYQDFFYNIPYMRAFLSNLILRPSCYNCKSKKYKSKGDLLIGDLWNKYDKNPYNNSQGTSIIIVNSHKGDRILQKCNIISEKIGSEYINKNNSGFRIHQYKNKNRERFFNEVYNNSSYSICHLMNLYSTFNFKDKVYKKLIKLLFK